MTAKPKTYKTPILRVKWNSLSDIYFANESDKKGSYSITLAGSPDEFGEFEDNISKDCELLYDEFCAKEGRKLKKADPYIPLSPEMDRDTGEESGRIQAKFKMNAQGVKKDGSMWKAEPMVVDKDGVPLPATKIRKIGRDSSVRVSFTLVPYLFAGKFGVAFRLRAVQLLQPVWYDPAGSSSDFEGDEVGVEDAYSVEADSDF